MTRRYIGGVTVAIHDAGEDGYLCRVTAGRTAVRLTVWQRRSRSETRARALDRAALKAFDQAGMQDPTIEAAGRASGGLGPNGWRVLRYRERAHVRDNQNLCHVCGVPMPDGLAEGPCPGNPEEQGS